MSVSENRVKQIHVNQGLGVPLSQDFVLVAQIPCYGTPKGP